MRGFRLKLYVLKALLSKLVLLARCGSAFRCWSSVVILVMGQMAHADMKFEGTMAWSAYNLGTTGYNQAVAIGKVLKDNYDVNLRVVPGKNDVSRLMPLIKGRVQYSANGVATYFAQEGVFQFAQPQWGASAAAHSDDVLWR